MKRLTAVATALALVAPAAGAATAFTAYAASSPTVKLGHTSVGRVLETASGRVLFMFSRDGRNADKCVAISGCPSVWPPLTVSGRPSAGPGVNGHLLGTINERGHRQVTYAGHALYTYTGAGPGDAAYVGTNLNGGVWDAVNAAGNAVR